MRTLLALGVTCCLAAPAFAADPPKLDRYGDPLPPGALMRFGTLRNRAPISSFGIQKDGTIITVSPAGQLRRWEANHDAHKVLIALPELEENGLGQRALVSPDGRLVAARVKDKLVVWEVPANTKAKPKEVATFDVAEAKRFCFSSDGSKLIATTGSETFPLDSEPHSAYLCVVKTGKQTKLEGTALNFSQVAFSGDGKRAVAMAFDQQGHRFFYWDSENGKQLADCKLEGRGCEACALNQKGDLLVVWLELNDKRVWQFFDPLTGKKRDDLVGPELAMWASFAPDDKTLLAGNMLGVQWWDPIAKKRLRRYQGDTSHAAARFSPDGTTLIAAGELLHRWEAETGKPLFESQTFGHTSWIFALGVSPDSKLIATKAFWDHRVCVWEAATGKQLWQVPSYDSHSRRLDFSPDGKFLYIPGEKENEIVKHDAITGKALQKYTPNSTMKLSGAYSIRVSSDGKTLTALMDLRSILTWNTESGKLLKTNSVVSEGWLFDLSPEATFFVSNGDNPQALVRPLADQSVNHLKDARFRIRHPGEFSSDGKWLTLIVSPNGPTDELRSAAVISTKTWKVVGGVSINKNGWAALSPNGETLAVAQNERLEFYTVETGKLIGGYDVPAGDWKKSDDEFTQVLRFTPDGTKLITGHTDTTALMWPVPRPAK